jgi:hypothetical protein
VSTQKNVIYGLALAALGFITTARAQDLVKEALASFPRETIRLEYSNPSRLRTLPNYASLRQHYIGPRLQTLEKSLAELGVREEDISELLLGWQPGQGEMELYGFATGRFNSRAIRSSAAARGLAPTPVAGQQSYCLEAGLAATCVLVLGESRGVFGSLALLTSLMDARGGQAPALGSDERFARPVGEAARTDAPIWGVAVGPAVSDWFRGWMPSQQSLQLDWSRAFGNVEALTYNVQVRDKVDLNVKLDCATPESAASLRQVLEGVRLFQQLAWQNQNPNRPNPFEALDVAVKNSRVELSLVTAYDAVGVGTNP